MAVASTRPWWVPPALALAALGASVAPVASGFLLMRDVHLGNFCNEQAVVGTERALWDAKVRRFHEQAAFPVGGCMAMAVAFGGAAGAALDRRWRRWLVVALVAFALGGFLAADFTGKQEAWHTLSPGLRGWEKMPLVPGLPSLSYTKPECAPEIRQKVYVRVAQVYWAHVALGLAMAASSAILGVLGMSWRRKEPEV